MADEDVSDDDALDDANIANLKRALRNYAAQLAEITISPKPTYELDGQKFEWTDYQKFLVTAIGSCKQAIQDLEGPFEIESQFYL